MDEHIAVRAGCDRALIERLEIDEGLTAIAGAGTLGRLFRRLAEKPDGNVVLAIADDRKIVGISLCGRPSPVEWQGRVIHDFWEGVPSLLELGSIEVSRDYRHHGLAHRLLTTAFADPAMEREIVIAQGLSWHWDTSETGGNELRYRED